MITLVAPFTTEHETLYAVLEVSEQLAQSLIGYGVERQILGKRLSGMYAIVLCDSEVVYYRVFEDADEFQDGTWSELSPERIKNFDPIRTDADTVKVTNSGVYWQGHLKHCGTLLETPELSFRELGVYKERCKAAA